ncbi:hypothetical protein [Commensalibacter oyaizuii]|uniref:Transmembrane protein n=1 Tax=Commensalibacter oyaizuii TaxID=3043873 RepID=A0ABT6Q1K7_9PROT|nr:hypothetical protein [Commensalibacter sp. TBRC 16381]MDI2090895.1 hypothetical protein [Commensalibacter sp. TBRC 16381]
MTKKYTLSFIHRIAGITALIILLIFWFSTVTTELSGHLNFIKNVKILIPYGFIFLIPALIIVSGTGSKMAGKINNPAIHHKKKRMPFIALNGLIILIPCALYLRYLAVHEHLDFTFFLIQIVELIAGGVNITLLMLNVLAGINLSKNKQRKLSM